MDSIEYFFKARKGKNCGRKYFVRLRGGEGEGAYQLTTQRLLLYATGCGQLKEASSNPPEIDWHGRSNRKKQELPKTDWRGPEEWGKKRS